VSTLCALSADIISQVGPEVAAAFGAKGGGRPGLYQGKALLCEASLEAARQLLDRVALKAGAS
jgi:hypothetical protein